MHMCFEDHTVNTFSAVLHAIIVVVSGGHRSRTAPLTHLWLEVHLTVIAVRHDAVHFVVVVSVRSRRRAALRWHVRRGHFHWGHDVRLSNPQGAGASLRRGEIRRGKLRFAGGLLRRWIVTGLGW